MSCVCYLPPPYLYEELQQLLRQLCVPRASRGLHRVLVQLVRLGKLNSLLPPMRADAAGGGEGMHNLGSCMLVGTKVGGGADLAWFSGVSPSP